MPTHYEGSEAERLALDTFIKLTRGADSFLARLLQHGTLETVTLSQFGVLEALYHLGPMCQGALSQKLLKSTGNMTLVIDNLEKHGMVQRVRSTEDRRMIQIQLTPAGEAFIARIFPAHAEAICEEMSVLTPDEQRELSRLCRKLGLSKPAASGCSRSSLEAQEEEVEVT